MLLFPNYWEKVPRGLFTLSQFFRVIPLFCALFPTLTLTTSGTGYGLKSEIFLESTSQFQVESCNPLQRLFSSHFQSGYNSHLMSLSSSFEGEVSRWINHWKRQSASDESISVSSLFNCEKCRQHLLPKREATSKTSRRLPVGSRDVYTRTMKFIELIFW